MQCMEVRREERKGFVQRPFTWARELRPHLPGPVDGRKDEAPSRGEGTARLQGPVRRMTRSPESGALAGIPHPGPGASPVGAENTSGWWRRRRGARRPAEGAAAARSVVRPHPPA